RVGEHVTVMAQVARTTVRRMRNRPGALLETLVTDGVHTLSLTFFGKHPGALRTHEHKLRPGAVGAFSGEVRVYRGELQLTHPAYQIIGVDQDDEHAAMAEASRPMPFYPASS